MRAFIKLCYLGYSIFLINACSNLLSDYESKTVDPMQIDEDICNSNYCLYRGTTSVINCVINNVYPIYLIKKKESTINILSNLKKLSKISKADELKKIVQNTNKNRINIKTKKFVKNYFTKVNFNVLLKFI